MRYAFVSDVHGNLPAWNTVLADLAVHRVDRIVCLGDTVGSRRQRLARRHAISNRGAREQRRSDKQLLSYHVFCS